MFEFLADHTKVDFALTSMTRKVPHNGTTKNVVSTSHDEVADVTMSTVVSANKNSFYINSLRHSHPGGTLTPSTPDRRYRDFLIKDLDQEIPVKSYLYIPNKINMHSAPINYRFGTDKYNKKALSGKYLGY